MPVIKLKNEPRKYMGPKWARVPRGTIVHLIAVINGKIEFDLLTLDHFQR